MIGHFASFGGTLKIGSKEFAVRGRTYRKIAELASWYLSECFCPISELRFFIQAHTDFAVQEFCDGWIKKTRQTLFCDPDTKRRLESTLSARRFEIWQACRDDGLTFDSLDEHLDSLSFYDLNRFLFEADRKMAIANGVDELSYLATCMRISILAVNDAGSTIESMLSRLCVKNERRWSVQEILDSTPAMLGDLFCDPDMLTNDAQQEAEAEKNSDAIMTKMASVTYRNMALNVLEKKRIDAERASETRRARKNKEALEKAAAPPTAAAQIPSKEVKVDNVASSL